MARVLAGAQWQASFDWVQGRLQVSSEGGWAEGRVLEQALNKLLVKVRYGAGTSETEEWLEKSSPRLRPAEMQASAPEASGPKAKAHTDEGKTPKAEAPSERPMRRSRLVADDARMAQELQLEELRLSCHRSAPKSKALKPPPRQQQEPKSPSKTAASGGKAPAGGGRGRKRKADEEEEAPPKKRGGGKAKAEVVEVKKEPSGGGKKDKKSPAGKAKKPDMPVITTASRVIPKSPPSIVADKPGQVSFVLAPSDGGNQSVVLPAMKKPKNVMGEDTTVQQIKRMVVDQVLPGDSTANLVLRTPAGMQLGNDHSLKFVRSFLWPPAKGQLCLFYSKENKAFF